MPVVLVDTNVWISALINPHGFPAQLKKAWLAGRFDAVMSLAILEEVAEVLMRPRIRGKYELSEGEIESFLRLLQERTRHVELSGELHLCRDPDDDQILETALLGGAQLLVSRDDDLKRDVDLIYQMRNHGVEVLSVRQFLEWLAE